ncbi:MAG: hypothetical protein ACOYL1_03925 [Chlamydiia bacterium]
MTSTYLAVSSNFVSTSFSFTQGLGIYATISKFSSTPFRHTIVSAFLNSLAELTLRPQFALLSGKVGLDFYTAGYANSKVQSLITCTALSTLAARITYDLALSPLAKIAIIAVHHSAMAGYTKNMKNYGHFPSLEHECARRLMDRPNTIFKEKTHQLEIIEVLTQGIAQTLLLRSTLHPITALTIVYPLSSVVKALAAKIFFDRKNPDLQPTGNLSSSI